MLSFFPEMKKDILKGIIRDFHLETPSGLFDRDIDAPLSSGKIISLVGVRRSGKTSFLFNLMEKLVKKGLDRKNILYLSRPEVLYKESACIFHQTVVRQYHLQ